MMIRNRLIAPFYGKAMCLVAVSLVIAASHALGQMEGVAINGSGDPPDASAMLDITSASKGILIPRLTTAQRLAISKPVNSLLVWDETVGAYYYYQSKQWIEVASAADIVTNTTNIASNTTALDSLTTSVDNKWDLSGSTGTTPGANFIGTTDAQDLVIKTNSQEALRVDSDGNTGIGTSAPTSTLHVYNTTGLGQLRVESPHVPSGTSDPDGEIGEITWGKEGNKYYFYLRTADGWFRTKLKQWGGNNNDCGPTLTQGVFTFDFCCTSVSIAHAGSANISKVKIKFTDNTSQIFNNPGVISGTWSGTGGNAGKEISKAKAWLGNTPVQKNSNADCDDD